MCRDKMPTSELVASVADARHVAAKLRREVALKAVIGQRQVSEGCPLPMIWGGT